MDIILLLISVIMPITALLLVSDHDSDSNSIAKKILILWLPTISWLIIAANMPFDEKNLIESKTISMIALNYTNGGLNQRIEIDPERSVNIHSMFNCYFPEGTKFEYKRYSKWRFGVYNVLSDDYSLTPIIKENKQ